MKSQMQIRRSSFSSQPQVLRIALPHVCLGPPLTLLPTPLAFSSFPTCSSSPSGVLWLHGLQPIPHLLLSDLISP